MKKQDADLIRAEIQAKEDAIKKREQEVRDRDERIQRIMSRMQDTVSTKQEKELKIKAERDYIEQTLAKDEAARQQDIRNKKLKREKELQIRQFLDN